MPTTKIFIAAHKDFANYPKSGMYEILSSTPLKCEYDIPANYIGDKCDDHLYALRDSYAELLKLFYAYQHSGHADYIGMCQYKRYFSFYDKEKLANSILKSHDAILPVKVPAGGGVIRQYGTYHRKQDLEECIDIARKEFPSFAKCVDEAMNAKSICAHNMFVMKQKDFRDYCFFLITILSKWDKTHGWNSIEDMKSSGIKQPKTHAFLAERLSNIFFTERFRSPHYEKVSIVV